MHEPRETSFEPAITILVADDFDDWRASGTDLADFIAHDCRLANTYVRRFDLKLRAADALFNRYSVPTLDTSESSIEEIASRIMNSTGIERRLPL